MIKDIVDKGTLLIVIAPHFVAGLLYKKKASPIINYMEDWDLGKIKWYCEKKNWIIKTFQEIKERDDKLKEEMNEL